MPSSWARSGASPRCLFGEIEACRVRRNRANEQRLSVSPEDLGYLPALAGRASRIKFQLGFLSVCLVALSAFWYASEILTVHALRPQTIWPWIVVGAVCLFSLLFVLTFLGPFLRSLRPSPTIYLTEDKKDQKESL
jgi:hypothetical protein